MDITFQFGDHLNLYGLLLFIGGGFLTGRLFRNIGILKIIGLFFLLSFFTKALQATGYHWTGLYPYIGFGIVGFFGWRRIADFFIRTSESIADFKYRVAQPFKARGEKTDAFNEARARYEEEVRRTRPDSEQQRYSQQEREEAYRKQEEDLRKREQAQRQREAEFEQKARHQANSTSRAHEQASDDRSAYDILGISSTATKEEIHRAYKECRQRYHPDKFATRSQAVQDAMHKEYIAVQEAFKKVG